MLNLEKSKVRRGVLLYYFTNPKSQLYVRELARILGVDAGNLAKELLRLEKDGILNSSKRSNQKYYAVNEGFALYHEFSSLVNKTIGLTGRLKTLFEEIKGVDCAFIYGSFAEDSQRADSDIDVLIIGQPDENAVLNKIEELERKLQREINYNIYSAKEFKVRGDKKDSFITNVIKGKKIVLKGDIRDFC